MRNLPLLGLTCALMWQGVAQQPTGADTLRRKQCHIVTNGVENPAACETGNFIPPKVTYSPEPQFSEEARKKKINASILVSIDVDAAGKPQNVQLLRGAGYGLDKQALLAASEYRFTPATLDGVPVTDRLRVEVTFATY